jgi:hypothetical protein
MGMGLKDQQLERVRLLASFVDPTRVASAAFSR